ncbi:MAG: M67 family metallopeptidase [Acidobacteriota bacterium]
MTPTQIRAEVLDALVAHAREDAPIECCGLLIARGVLIDESVRTTNLRRSDVVYLIDPAAHFAEIRRARLEGRVIAGAYHSHPRSPALPSATDLAEAQTGDFLYVIVSLAGGAPDVRGYRLADGNFVEVPLVPVP